MKVLALNLPAFHQIKENDLWWGEGFTEWDNVKKGKPLYKNHIQPQEPLNDNYYNLSSIDSLRWQAKTAKEYGLSGFIYYHYWFTGHKIFEKPIEMIRDDKSIDFEYCLCWANETWSRTWEGNNKDVLIAQNYGDENDWIEHIKYLTTFFSDSRYIKINGSPVLFIYSMNDFNKFNQMIEVWNKYLCENGMHELHLIEFIRAKNNVVACKYSKGIIEFEPLYSIRYDISFFRKTKRFICKKLKLIDFQNYDKIWHKILKRKRTYDNRIIYRSCFCSWDNSPRKGRKNSIILRGSSPEKFGKYFQLLLDTNRSGVSDDITVINAWNEWGEGAMLEPTKSNGYKYLEELQKAILSIQKRGKL